MQLIRVIYIKKGSWYRTRHLFCPILCVEDFGKILKSYFGEEVCNAKKIELSLHDDYHPDRIPLEVIRRNNMWDVCLRESRQKMQLLITPGLRLKIGFEKVGELVYLEVHYWE